MAKPHWDDNKKMWILDARIDGVRKQFYSSVAGKKGLKAVNDKYQAFLLGETSTEKTLSAVCREYLEDIIDRLGEKSETYIQNERYLRLYVLPKLGKYKMCKITLRQWQSVLNEARGVKGELSKKTLMNLKGIITLVIKYGYQNYQCEELRGDLYVPKGRLQKEKEILQPEEIKRLLLPSDKWYHPMFCFALYTGMRPGEILGLQAGDVKGSVIRIKRSVNAQGLITEGKNTNARREVPIGASARQILNDTIERNKRLKLNTEWIFCDKNGNPGNQSTMRNQWNELKKERNLSGTVYSLRHTFISLMKYYMPEASIKEIVGHSASMPTLRTYGHIVDEELEKSGAIIDTTLSKIAK